MIEVTLPYPPTVNHYWGRKHRMSRDRSGKLKVFCQTFIKQKGKLFHKLSGWQFKANGIRETLTSNLSVTIDVYPPDRRIRDIDNLFKAIADTLEKNNVIKNDNQIQSITISKRDVEKPHGKVVVKISEILG